MSWDHVKNFSFLLLLKLVQFMKGAVQYVMYLHRQRLCICTGAHVTVRPRKRSKAGCP